jgi:preprotein translocase subunit SecE
MLPQAQQGVRVFFGIFAVVVGIIFVIFGFDGEMPRGC